MHFTNPFSKNQIIAMVFGVIATAGITGAIAWNGAQERAHESEMQRQKFLQESLQAIRKSEAEAERQRKIDECFDLAYIGYSADWDTACTNLGLKANCGLPAWRAENLESQLKEKKNICLKRY